MRETLHDALKNHNRSYRSYSKALRDISSIRSVWIRSYFQVTSHLSTLLQFMVLDTIVCTETVCYHWIVLRMRSRHEVAAMISIFCLCM